MESVVNAVSSACPPPSIVDRISMRPHFVWRQREE